MTFDQEKHILITGFGGQGIIMAGDILGKAATLYDDKNATMTQNYGPEARGGSCSSQVIISTEDILFPSVNEPQVLVCMSQEGYTKNIKSLRRNGTLYLGHGSRQNKKGRSDLDTYHIPATRFAEELGNTMMANIVMLGFLAAVEALVQVDALRKAVLDSVPPNTKENNAKAFDRGREYGEAILKGRAKQEPSRDRA